jgi:hypothetical protein
MHAAAPWQQHAGTSTEFETHPACLLLAALEPEDLSYLEPRLEAVILPKGTILHEAGDPIQYTYFPHDAIMGLINVMRFAKLRPMHTFSEVGA